MTQQQAFLMDMDTAQIVLVEGVTSDQLREILVSVRGIVQVLDRLDAIGARVQTFDRGPTAVRPDLFYELTEIYGRDDPRGA